jgi:hypothetical protein
MSDAGKPVMIRMPRDLYEHLREAAKRDRRSIVNTLYIVVEAWLEGRQAAENDRSATFGKDWSDLAQ